MLLGNNMHFIITPSLCLYPLRPPCPPLSLALRLSCFIPVLFVPSSTLSFVPDVYSFSSFFLSAQTSSRAWSAWLGGFPRRKGPCFPRMRASPLARTCKVRGIRRTAATNWRVEILICIRFNTCLGWIKKKKKTAFVLKEISISPQISKHFCQVFKHHPKTPLRLDKLVAATHLVCTVGGEKKNCCLLAHSSVRVTCPLMY